MRKKFLFLVLLAANTLMAQVPLKIKTVEKEYQMEEATKITFSEDLAVQNVLNGEDTLSRLPMQSIREVVLLDTLQNMLNYIAAEPDCQIYYWAANVEISRNSMYEGSYVFNCYFKDPLQWKDATAYTPELKSRFALFVPTDNAFNDFPWPLSLASLQPCALSISYRGTGTPIVSARRYDPETGEVAIRIRVSVSYIDKLLNEILLQNTVLFDRPEDRELGIRSGNEYFLTLGGTVVRVAPDGKSVQGAFQMDNAAKGIEPFSACNIIDSHQKSNGTIYKIDCPILPPSIQKSAYSVLQGEEYEEFFKLCDVNEEVLNALGLTGGEDLSDETQVRLRTFFKNFVQKNGADYNLSFFPSHPFTLYAPTNEAVRQAIADGLPTWESLAAAYGGGVGSDAEREEGQRKVYELINFVRYHFHFGTEIADKLPFAAREHATPVILPDGYVTPALRVSSAGNGTLSVTDATGQTLQVMDEGKNVFVRDVECSRNPIERINDLYAVCSSPGVIHRINGVLRYK